MSAARRALLKERPAETLALDDPSVAVRLVARERARRLTLRLEPGGGAVVSHPPGVARDEILKFLGRHREWLRSALERVPGSIEVDLGVAIPVDGEAAEIVAAPVRAPRLEGGRLWVRRGRPAGPQIAAWLKARARDRLSGAVALYAGRLGRQPRAVSLRDTRSRWGSCSAEGRISLSWRLAMAPESVQFYVAAHEVAHLAEMNHGPRFWGVLGEIMPGYEPERAWLKTHGRSLHRYRFEG